MSKQLVNELLMGWGLELIDANQDDVKTDESIRRMLYLTLQIKLWEFKQKYTPDETVPQKEEEEREKFFIPFKRRGEHSTRETK